MSMRPAIQQIDQRATCKFNANKKQQTQDPVLT